MAQTREAFQSQRQPSGVLASLQCRTSSFANLKHDHEQHSATTERSDFQGIRRQLGKLALGPIATTPGVLTSTRLMAPA
eukprot:4013388-Prymnesium_polylepis.1